MNKKKKIILALGILTLNVFIALAGVDTLSKNYNLTFTYVGDGKEFQLYYSGKVENYNEVDTYHMKNIDQEGEQNFKLSKNVRNLRLDFGSEVGQNYAISDLILKNNNGMVQLDNEVLDKIITNDCDIKILGTEIKIVTTGADPYIKFPIAESSMASLLEINDTLYIALACICLFIDILILLFISKLQKSSVGNALISNRKLIWSLSKNDFRTKFAGSFFGIFWAFVSPIVTILVYWFVFQVGFRSADIGETPFVLWLIVGIVPWFFFQDAITAGTNALIDYSYLVKKVVFKIDILPLVKIISALFVHAFFLLFAFIIFACYGYMPSLYSLQVIYYLISLLALLIGLTFVCCAVVIFFKDLSQIIQISLQIGTWMTPILWNYATTIPEKYVALFKINPMFYIVEGYRDSFINHVWFWEKPLWTLYYWGVVILLLIIGRVVFKRLKDHFADVL